MTPIVLDFSNTISVDMKELMYSHSNVVFRGIKEGLYVRRNSWRSYVQGIVYTLNHKNLANKISFSNLQAVVVHKGQLRRFGEHKKSYSQYQEEKSEIDAITGWKTDPISKLPIDPSTGKTMSKTEYKKRMKQAAQNEQKTKKLKEKEEEHDKTLEQKLRSAVTITEDQSLPKANRITVDECFQNPDRYADQRIELCGYVFFCFFFGMTLPISSFFFFLKQQKQRMFVDLRDGTGIPPRIQCVFEGDLVELQIPFFLKKKKKFEINIILELDCLEASIVIRGKAVKRETNEKDARPIEVLVDYYEVIGGSSPDVESIVNKDANPQVLYDQRHWIIRSERTALTLKMRCYVTQAFRQVGFFLCIPLAKYT
ncbi:cytoplasmic asparaginyl-tRNA synthetase [Reticulomyxa filosa]|uniref:Cytoplasmic asparaginyl-tRNA synthetase n=1 Tax=Reticulomyxa filosa TaxID=46433 RepID=X6MBL6_RETFI|nr:cytoplasmic asparaginyl-tRNA synthetase [Reticulomyxa filosa]|eukprot:ETO10420.1 cytoplasmic asparaginyl-tRNA synthetase [Reticulomyxa filosa]